MKAPLKRSPLLLGARYSLEIRRALAAFDSEEEKEEELTAGLGALDIRAYNMHPDVGNFLSGDNNTEEIPHCGDAGTFILGAENKPKKIEYLSFTPDSLNHIGRQTVAELREKYTQTGENYNLAFKMLNSDTKLVKTVLHSHGFTQCSRKNPSFNILWCGSSVRATHMRTIQPWQRINQFPRSTELTRKDKLYDNLARSASIFGDAYSFVPEYFVTPRDVSLLETAMEQSMSDLTYIVKPVSSSQGKGIFFASKTREIPQSEPLLVSRYIENPLLIDGHKFDLRIYVAVTSFYPLVAYVYSEGLTRVASEKYCSETDTQDAFVHLTNYSINKNNSHFVRNESMACEDFGHKWTLGALLRHLEKKGIDAKMVMLRIEDIVVKSLLSVQNRITSACRTTTPHVGTNFELFGFDILVDDDLKPWLLEVILRSLLSSDAPLDSLVKSRLICDLFNLACVPLVNRKLAGIQLIRPSKEEEYESDYVEPEPEKTKKNSPSKRNFNAKRRRIARLAFAPSPYAPDPSMRAICRRTRTEMSRRGGFVRIFPREHSLQLYRCVMERIGSENRDERLYYKEFGVEEDEDNEEDENSLSTLFHDAMMNTGMDYGLQYPSLESMPQQLQQVLHGWHNEASAYTQRITKEGQKYAVRKFVFVAKLPVVRPSARLRTKSCSEWYEVKKAMLAEAKLKLQQEQEEGKDRKQRKCKTDTSECIVVDHELILGLY
ncbi:unnamed protein product [Strongylus vulgaris]|uniref:Tubulin--tyrosine ligase-like protein 5 n=1 Tax=Strongylus vulgaris TaxID=40348 RepID=A0A3P7IHP4_STRVU|nr:unnamed protein product [Strongylus vulgaris]